MPIDPMPNPPSPDTLTVILVDGTRVVVQNDLQECTPYVLQEQGDWYEDEIRFLRRLVQPGQQVVDIGANLGVYALSLARRVGPTGQVWAFEPAEHAAALLAESIKVNGTTWLHLERQALFDQSDSSLLKTMSQIEHSSLAPDPQRWVNEVHFTTLDACLETFRWRQIDLLRIDARGEEEAVIASGVRFFSEHSPLVMFRLRTGALLHLKLVKKFEALGYRTFRLVPELGILAPFDVADGIDGFLINLFAARQDQVALLASDGWLVERAASTGPGHSELGPYNWRITLNKLPYGSAMVETWSAAEHSQDNETNSEALALWAFCQDHTQPIQERFNALKRSYQLLSQLCKAGCPASRWSSLARVAQALGERLHAVRAVGNLIPLLEEGQAADLPEPFLAPNQSHEALDPQDRVTDWLEAAAWEADELIGNFSGFYTGPDSLPRLKRIKALGFVSAAAHRRLELVLRRFPEPPPATPTMEKANPEQILLSRQAWDWIEKGRWEQAQEALSEALAMGDCSSEAVYFMGKSLFQLGDNHHATILMQRAVELAPENPTYLLDLGVHLMDAGQAEAGEAVVQQAVFLYGFLAASSRLTPKDFANLGIAYDNLGDTENALASLDQALALEPKRANARRRKASILNRTEDRQGEALKIWEDMQKEDPEDVSILLCVAGANADVGELQTARDLLNQALKLAPGHLFTYMKLAWVTSISGKPGIADHLRYLQHFWILVKERWPEGGPVAPVIFALPACTGKVRVGILSAEVGEHVVGLFLEPFLRHYDRSQLEVELIQTREISGGFADLLRAKGDAVLTVQNLRIPAARHRIRSRGYHVIVETSGFTKDTGISILASRCAPVQCHYIGFHASTGLDTIDWFIGDELTAAVDLQNQYVERLWRLPRPWLACRLDPNLPEAESVLQDESPVLGSFNQFGKVREETLAFWAAALRRIPEATLKLKSFTAGSYAPVRRILDGLAEAGVDPDRVVFLPRSPNSRKSLESYRGIDVALDATPWSGATTCFDALSMGLPVVGIRGETTASRMSSSILRGIGRENWVANTPDDFAAIVAELVSDLPRLRASRNSLRHHVLASPLFDGADLAQHLQEALLSMAKEYAVQAFSQNSLS